MAGESSLFDDRTFKAGDCEIRLTQAGGVDGYRVEISFPLDAKRVYTSRWLNPLAVALEAAEKALSELKTEFYSTITLAERKRTGNEADAD